MSRLFSSPGVLGRERPPEPVVVKGMYAQRISRHYAHSRKLLVSGTCSTTWALFLLENSETREDGAGPSAENVVWLPDAIETIESVPDATETIESVPDATVDSCCDESKCRIEQVVQVSVYIVLIWE